MTTTARPADPTLPCFVRATKFLQICPAQIHIVQTIRLGWDDTRGSRDWCGDSVTDSPIWDDSVNLNSSTVTCGIKRISFHSQIQIPNGENNR
jgi:hypothetical protein